MFKSITSLFCIVSLVLLASCGGLKDPEHGFQRNGSYKLFPEEQKLSCSAVKDRVHLGVANIAKLKVKAQQMQAVSIGLAIASVALSGGSGFSYRNLSAQDQAALNKERAKVDAYNGGLSKKGCGTLNVDQLIENKMPKYNAPKKPRER